MREKHDLKPFDSKKLEPDRGRRFGALRPEELFSAPGTESFIHSKRESKPPVELLEQRESLSKRRDLLFTEIKRGKDYLQQVQKDLSDSRASLEQWSRYEQICSAHPLDYLIQTMTLQERTQQFLVGWLQRQGQKLAAIKQRLESLPKLDGPIDPSKLATDERVHRL
jgi:hypothetical protein